MKLRNLYLLVNDKRRRNFFIYGLGQAFNLLSPLLVAPYIISVCQEQGFGKVGLGFGLSLFLILIVDYAFEIQGTKQASESRDDSKALQKLFSTVLLTKFILFLFTGFVALLLVSAIPFMYQEKSLFLLSMAVVFAQVFNPSWFLQGIEDFTLASILNICSKTVYVILVFNCINNPDDYVLVNLILGLSTLFFNICGVGFILIRKHFKIVLPTKTEILFILQRDFSFCVSQLLLSVRQLSPLFMVGYFLGYHTAGQYKVMEQIITLFRTFIQVYLRYFYPAVCYKVKAGSQIAFAFWKKYSGLMVLSVTAALFLIGVFSREILAFFNAAPQSMAQLDTIFRVALLVPLLMALTLPLEQLMFVIDKSKAYFRITALVTVVNIMAILLLISSYQLYGIVISLILSEMLFIVLYFKNGFLFLRRKELQNS